MVTGDHDLSAVGATFPKYRDLRGVEGGWDRASRFRLYRTAQLPRPGDLAVRSEAIESSAHARFSASRQIGKRFGHPGW